jgi:hypothetical protein
MVLGHGMPRFIATPHSTIRSARTNGVRGSSSSRRRRSVVRSNGRFATTLNGSRGSVIFAASASTTSTFDHRPRRAAAYRVSSSTAMTRPATRASSAVSRPLPAPRSRTTSLGPRQASPTISAASSRLRRTCWLRGNGRRAPRARRPATEDAGRRHNGHRREVYPCACCCPKAQDGDVLGARSIAVTSARSVTPKRPLAERGERGRRSSLPDSASSGCNRVAPSRATATRSRTPSSSLRRYPLRGAPVARPRAARPDQVRRARARRRDLGDP